MKMTESNWKIIYMWQSRIDSRDAVSRHVCIFRKQLGNKNQVLRY